MRHLALVLVSLAAACGQATRNAGTSTDRVLVIKQDGMPMHQYTGDERISVAINLPADKAFTAISQAYTLLGIPPTTSDRTGLQYGNEGLVMPNTFNGHHISAYFRCGEDITGALVGRGRLIAAVMTTVEATTPTTATATTHVTGSMTRNEGTSGAPLNCTSTGQLEEDLRIQVEKLVSSASPKGTTTH